MTLWPEQIVMPVWTPIPFTFVKQIIIVSLSNLLDCHECRNAWKCFVFLFQSLYTHSLQYKREPEMHRYVQSVSSIFSHSNDSTRLESAIRKPRLPSPGLRQLSPFLPSLRKKREELEQESTDTFQGLNWKKYVSDTIFGHVSLVKI